MKDKLVKLRVPPEEYAAWSSAALDAGQNISEWALGQLRQWIKLAPVLPSDQSTEPGAAMWLEPGLWLCKCGTPNNDTLCKKCGRSNKWAVK